MQLGIIGAGSWGSALAIAGSYIATNVTLFARNNHQVLAINQTRSNLHYLEKHILFSQNVRATNTLSDIISSDIIIIATPVAGFRDALIELKKLILQSNKMHFMLLWVCKGFELNTGLLPSQIFNTIFNIDKQTNYLSDTQIKIQIGALLGPSFAAEVARGLPTAMSMASDDESFAIFIANKFSKIPNFRVYANNDLTGAEISAGVKNIIAIAVGISDGLSLGYNARAALITRSLNELSKLITKMHGKITSLYGLGGIGDLILTSTGDLSRNRQVGIKLASGMQIDDILTDLSHVAEGVYASREVYKLGQIYQIDLPIINAVYNIIYCKANIQQIIADLFNRDAKLEFLSS